MRFVTVTGTAAVFLCVATMIPVYAQHEENKQGERNGGPAQQREQHAPPGQQHAERPQQPDRAQQPPQQQPHVQQPPRPERVQQPQVQQQRPERVQQQPQVQQQRPERVQQQPQVQQRRPERVQEPPQQQQRVQQQAPQRVQQPQQQQQRAQGTQPYRVPQQRTQQQARGWQQQRGWLQQGAWQGKNNFQQFRSQRWASDHRTWSQRGGYGGYYIPQQTFGLYFGLGHYFRIGVQPSMYLGYPRFQYGGYSFLLLDPWPSDWDPNWYDADDLYIDWDGDGYYLYNRSYPYERLAVTIVV